MAREALNIADQVVAPGTSVTIDLPLGQLYTHTDIFMPIQIIHGRRDGPTLFVSSAIHGDELLGVEIIRRILNFAEIRKAKIRGTIIAVPVVNVLGYQGLDRYLPDRRDLNRAFPGSTAGSMASRLANVFMTEIVQRSTCGIDLHTGSNHRYNLPQVRASVDQPQVKELATAFGAPVILDSKLREGSLRAAALDRGVPVIVYEGGEALRYDEFAIKIGVRGIRRTMRHLGMIPNRSVRITADSFVARASFWIRAPQSGVFHQRAALGEAVAQGDELGSITDLFGRHAEPILSPASGIIIACSHLPIAQEGEAIYHVAIFDKLDAAANSVEQLQQQPDPDVTPREQV